MTAEQCIGALADAAVNKGWAEAEDRDYYVNLLLEIMQMDAPGEGEACDPLDAALELTQSAAENGLFKDTLDSRERFCARLLGAVTPHPSRVRETFRKLFYEKGVVSATDWFYTLCRDNDYIRTRQIKQNMRFMHASPCGELEITINLSKPEKDPRDIAVERRKKQSGYPLCLLCKENPGYAGRNSDILQGRTTASSRWRLTGNNGIPGSTHPTCITRSIVLCSVLYIRPC